MRTFSLAVLALVISACQATNKEALQLAKPAWDEVRASLPELSKLMDEPGERGLEGLSWVERDASSSNTSFLTLEQLIDPDAAVDDETELGRLDHHAGGDFLHCLQWTGPRSKMSSDALKERSGERLSAECRDALETQYLVVLETLASTLPLLTDENTFAGGAATLRVRVVARLEKKLLASFLVEGKPGQVVRSEVRPEQDKVARMAAAVHAAMWSNARQQLFDRLRSRGAHIEPR